MNINLVDVNVHISDRLDEQAQTKLEDALRALDGMVSIKFQEHNPHLLLVDFNPAKLKAQDVLSCVKGQGLEAALAGL